MTRAATRSPGKPRSTKGSPRSGKFNRRFEQYWTVSESPLHSLVFILPLLAIFETGVYLHHSRPIALYLLLLFFSRLGVHGQLVPACLLVVILLVWHMARKDKWRLHPGVLCGMPVESILLALPLLGVWTAMTHFRLHMPPADDVVLALGAGIYEEMLFRLGLITLLTLLCQDVLKMPTDRTTLLVVAGSAICFSLYHYLGAEHFRWDTFVFRAVAGVYFAVLFTTRGFGITVGTHAAYDILVAALIRGVA